MAAYTLSLLHVLNSFDAEGTVAAREAVGDDAVMLDSYQTKPPWKYRPLNGSGVVFHSPISADCAHHHSYYAVQAMIIRQFLVTLYMTNL